MELKIFILGGERQGAELTLYENDRKVESSIFLLEDEAIEIHFSSEEYHDSVSLLLYENEVTSTLIEKDGNGWTYKWLPKRLGRYSYECFFHNFFGLAELTLEIKNGERTKLLDFLPIEIYAKKINADRVESMLNFLAKTDSEALCSFFRVTRRKAGYKNGDTPAEVLLEQIENTVIKISSLISKILKRPISKLTIRERYVYPTDTTNVNDITLSWLCSNADELYETDSYENAILETDNTYYASRKLIDHQAVEDYDVYENQVLHGFIKILIQTASSLLSGFESPEKIINKINGNPAGYISFFSQIQKFQKSINERKILKCKSILSNLYYLKKSMMEVAPTRKDIVGIPTFTMKAKKDSLYLSAFKKIVDWYRFGKPDWSVQEELLSIQSIPKLFEYYSLFYLKDIIEKQIGMKPLSEVTNDAMCFKFQRKSGCNIELLYEPKYWMVNHPMSDLRGLVNSEGWTVYNGVATQRSTSGRFSNRSPDYVIKLSNECGASRFFILDAKYTSTEKSFLHYLPSLTLKYIHGLRTINNIKNSVMGLMIINPDNNPSVRDFHHGAFDVFSETPSLPLLVCSSISPGEEFSNNKLFENSISRLVQIGEKSFLSCEVGEEKDKYMRA